MDDEKAASLIAAERERIETLLSDTNTAGQSDRSEANSSGAYDNAAERLTAEEGDDAIAASLRARLAALDRARSRLDAGTYGMSVRSGAPIEAVRLEADPAAELTAEEAQRP